MIVKWLALALALAPLPAMAQAVTHASISGTVASGGVAQTIAAAAPNRRGCIIQNQSTADLWVSSIGTAAATQPSFRVPAGAQYICSTPASGGAISIFGATTGQAFAAREW